MSYVLLPTLKGLSWSIFKRPTFSTRVAKHVSGREVRASLYAYPLYEFELNYTFLRSGADAELQTLMGFFLERQGQFDSFLFMNATDGQNDDTVTNQVLGVGDGTTVAFTALRSTGGWVEPVGFVNSVSQVSIGGVVQNSGWALQAPNTIVFNTAPPIGEQVTASFIYSYQCRFLDDVQEYENFLFQLWQMKSLKFRSIKP